MKIVCLVVVYLLAGQPGIKTTATVQQNKKVTHTKGYKPLNSFKNDTLQYLTYNLIDRKNTYVGKELNVLLDDLDVQVMSFMYSPGIDMKVYDFTLMLESYNTALVMKQKNKKPVVISVDFNSPIDLKFVHDNRTNDSYEWTQKQRDIYGKKIFIKNIYVLEMKNNRISR